MQPGRMKKDDEKKILAGLADDTILK